MLGRWHHTWQGGHWPPSLTHCRFGVLPGAHLHHLCWDAGITPGRAGHWPPSLTHCRFGVLPGAHLHHLCWDAGITPGRAGHWPPSLTHWFYIVASEFYLELTFIICAGTLALHLAGWSLAAIADTLSLRSSTWSSPSSSVLGRWHHTWQGAHWPPSLTHCCFGVLPGAHLHHLCWDTGITPGRAGHWPPSLKHCRFGVLPGAHLHHLCWDACITPGRVVTGRHR